MAVPMLKPHLHTHTHTQGLCVAGILTGGGIFGGSINACLKWHTEYYKMFQNLREFIKERDAVSQSIH